MLALFKKGDIGDCNNYRPICLISVGYKLYASILLARIKEAGADQRIWGTQYGFKARRGTADAILLVRRIIEQVHQRVDGKILMLAFDWKKAFDSISPERLLCSLRRFGIPNQIGEAISGIYEQRKFFVKRGHYESVWYDQSFGMPRGVHYLHFHPRLR